MKVVRWSIVLAALILVPAALASARTPVVLIPGLTGTELQDPSGRVVWGNGRSLLWPRDGGYEIMRKDLVPSGPVLRIRLFGLYRRPVYGPLLRFLEHHGYRLGELDAPLPDADLYVFSYDWRRDNVQAAQLLAGRLEALRLARGDDSLHVVLLCQSNSALIGRYLAKYGAADLEQAEAGNTEPPERIQVDKLILVGVANGGLLGVLADMNRGRRYVPGIGRRWLPEVLFTFPSLYESLPVYRRDLFFDAEGRTLDVDLFDAGAWERFGWSVFAPQASRRIERRRQEQVFGDLAERRRFLERSLDRAQRLHRLLASDPRGFRPPRYYLVSNASQPSPGRFLLVEDGDRWRTLSRGDRRVRRNPKLLGLAESAGDGRATLESQQWLSPGEQAALARPPVEVAGRHFDMILKPETLRHVLEFLRD